MLVDLFGSNHLVYLCLILLFVTIGGDNVRGNDVIFNMYLINGYNVTFYFELLHNEAVHWTEKVRLFSTEQDVNETMLLQYVEEKLILYAYPDAVLNGKGYVGLSSTEAIRLISLSVAYVSSKLIASRMKSVVFETNDNVMQELYFRNQKAAMNFLDSNIHVDTRLLLLARNDPNQTYSCQMNSTYSHGLLKQPQCRTRNLIPWMNPSLLPKFITNKKRIVLYQSLGVNTGGTTALRIFHR